MRKEYRLAEKNDKRRLLEKNRKLTMVFIQLGKIDEIDSVNELVQIAVEYKPRTPKWKEYRL